MMPDGFRDTGIGPVPVEWDVTPLGSLASVRYGKGKPKREGAVPVIGSGGIYAWVDEPLVAFPTLVLGRKGTGDAGAEHTLARARRRRAGARAGGLVRLLAVRGDARGPARLGGRVVCVGGGGVMAAPAAA